jgi:hypothetical protein
MVRKLALNLPGKRHTGGRVSDSIPNDAARLPSALNGDSIKGSINYIDERTREQLLYGGDCVDVHTWTRFTVPEALERLSAVQPERVQQALQRLRAHREVHAGGNGKPVGNPLIQSQIDKIAEQLPKIVEQIDRNNQQIDRNLDHLADPPRKSSSEKDASA